MINARIDTATMDVSIRGIDRSLESIGESLDPHGRAEVVTSKRKKMDHERANKRLGIKGQKALAGHHIANFLRVKGHDPFMLPEKDFNYAQEFIDREITAAVAIARRTGRPQRGRVKQTLIGAADYLADRVVERIWAGGLGTNARKYIRTKFRYVEQGLAARGGIHRIPPYGVLTGRFVRGIRWRWRQGYRPRGR